jgi:serine/threonine-protein kinase
MSRVFLAEELALGRKVVLKVLPPDLAAVVSVDRFRREIHLAASLQHPHIVPLHAAGSADGLLYYTMPLVEGESLRAKLSREGEQPIAEAVKLLRDVADALACAHEHGVLHRDIKPDNILVSRHHALVADFGVAKALSAASGKGAGTTEGVALGTPAYMAPEQAAADPHTDHRADIYALGVVGYEMLAGNTPFPGLSGQAALAAHATKPAPPVTEARPSVPMPLATLIMRCLEKHPADRWQSADEVLQRLEAMTTPSGGTAPTGAMPARRQALRRRRLLPLIGAGVAAVLVVAAIALRRPNPGALLDANLLAVAPFDALGGDLELWREGLVDLLSRNLDGAGPLRTVSPTVVVRRWSGRADPASAAALGRRTGAGLAVFGSLVAAGQDSVRLDAAILDVGSWRTVGEVRLLGDSRHMDRLADSLAVSLLRELGRTRDIVAVRTAGLRATSLPALKAFLEGEQLYRRSAWDSAQRAYRRALALDSTFVPAIRHLAKSLWWRAPGDDEYLPHLFRAGQLNHGLPRRDSLLVAVDSLYAALAEIDDLTAESRRSLSRRLFATLEEAVRIYPDDPEVWYELGEARQHGGWMSGVTRPQVLEAFDRSIALDSSFAPAYAHPLHLGIALSGLQGWHRYARPYFALDPQDDYLRLLDAILSVSPARTDHGDYIDSLTRSARVDRILDAVFAASEYPDSAETAVRLSRALIAAPGHSTGYARDPVIRRHTLAATLAYRGHVREARTLLEEEDDLGWVASLPAEMALVGAVPADTSATTFARWLRHRPLWSPAAGARGGPPAPLMFALPWWAARKDTLSILAFALRSDSAQHVASPPRWQEMARYGGDAARAYLVLARGDTAAALLRFQALPHDVWWSALERVTEAQILSRRGRDAEALELFDTAFPNEGWAGPVRVVTRLEAARIAERLGRKQRAADEYQYVAAVLRHADPELQSYVAEARQGLARLTSEPRP